MKHIVCIFLIGLLFIMLAKAADDVTDQNPSVRFHPRSRAVGDVMPYYYNGEYHVFYLLNASGNMNINWEHAVSKDLVHWKYLPPAIPRDPNDKTGPEGGCIFTGSIIEDHGVFHAFYTGWNPENPKGREFICQATSTNLISWTKHPEDMIGPDGIHYANNHYRDFRDPCVVWDTDIHQYKMFITADQPGRSGLVFGVLTSSDLKRWKQQPAIKNIPGDECPDFFKLGNTYYLHGCNVYAYSTNEDGPWQYPFYNKLDRRMAAKLTYDGRRYVWIGGWLRGPMSIPREVYGGPNGLLYMKPVKEMVDMFSIVNLSVTNLSLTGDRLWTYKVPLNYLLTATVDMSQGQALDFMVRGSGTMNANHIVVSADKHTLITTGGDSPEFRPLPINFTEPVIIQAFILDGVAEVFIDSKFAWSFFLNPAGGVLVLESHGDNVIQSLQVKTFENDNQPKK